jgi:hypothetical protein
VLPWRRRRRRRRRRWWREARGHYRAKRRMTRARSIARVDGGRQAVELVHEGGRGGRRTNWQMRRRPACVVGKRKRRSRLVGEELEQVLTSQQTSDVEREKIGERRKRPSRESPAQSGCSAFFFQLASDDPLSSFHVCTCAVQSLKYRRAQGCLLSFWCDMARETPARRPLYCSCSYWAAALEG